MHMQLQHSGCDEGLTNHFSLREKLKSLRQREKMKSLRQREKMKSLRQREN